MLWQYRTILFEFTKDGLLGDKYVDDEEMEKSLNELGEQEWDLVNVSLLQDGLLAFLKRPARAEEVVAERPRAVELPPPVIPSRPVITPRNTAASEQLEKDEREHVRSFDRQRNSALRNEENDFVGDIRIS